MHNLYSFVVLAVLATLALAAPTPERITKRSFTVPRIRNPAYVRDPAQAMARAYRKFGWGDLLGSDSIFGLGSGEQGGSGQGASSTSSATTSVASSSNNSDSEDNSGSSESSATSSSAAAATSTTAPFSNSTATSAASAAANSTSSTGETGTVAAKPAESGAEYISPISVGGQSLNMDFDTGSADLWVFSTSLSSSEIGSHATYDPSKSSTFKKLDGYTFSISYGDGSGASGTVGTDTVDIGGATVTSQAVELATSVSSAFVQDANSDGLVGLAFSSLNSVKPKTQNTFYQNIMSSLEQPVRIGVEMLRRRHKLTDIRSSLLTLKLTEAVPMSSAPSTPASTLETSASPRSTPAVASGNSAALLTASEERLPRTVEVHPPLPTLALLSSSSILLSPRHTTLK